MPSAIGAYFLSFDEVVLKLIDIEIVDDKIKCLKLEHEKYGSFQYYTNKEDFKIDNYFKAKLNKKTRVISTIISDVHNIK